MSVRRLLATALAVVGVLTAAPAEAATTYRLDGRNAKAVDYRGELTMPMHPSPANARSYPEPKPADCAKESCDEKALRLTLPRGTSWGKLRAVVTLPAELQAAVYLYDAKGAVKRSDEMATRPTRARQVECCEEGFYTLEVSHGMLPAGTYTLLVVDRAGIGEFSARVEWSAHPPDRPLDRRR